MTIDPALLGIMGGVVGSLIAAIVALYKREAERSTASEKRIVQLEGELRDERAAREKLLEEIIAKQDDRVTKAAAIAEVFNRRGGMR